jgi:hypothetical protein
VLEVVEDEWVQFVKAGDVDGDGDDEVLVVLTTGEAKLYKLRAPHNFGS